jgi:vacuolar-type H+-ATPase subunit H
MNSLAQETIEAIRDAEAAAAAKEKEARESADQLVSKARTDAAALIKSRTDAMKEETQSALTQAGLRNEKIMQDAKEEAQKEIMELQQQVAKKRQNAVKAVIDLLVS